MLKAMWQIQHYKHHKPKNCEPDLPRLHVALVASGVAQTSPWQQSSIEAAVRSGFDGGMGLLAFGRVCEVSVLITLPTFQLIVFWFSIVIAMVICTCTHTY